jgi:AraC family transcriptional regulator of adaptative response/methylated-DNA-[protein]-cysteine methyltransferase
MAAQEGRLELDRQLTTIVTPVGEMVAAATRTHLVLFEFAHRRMLPVQLQRLEAAVGGELVPGESAIITQLRRELDEYFGGARREFTIPLYAPGTPFQMKVWNELLRIPVGTTTTYARVASAIGHSNAVRAVARANGDNRIAILIPCHRVIGSDGSLTGYGGGLSRKKKLLDLEARATELKLDL